MKSNVQTLNHSASHRLTSVVNQWLNTPSVFFSEITGETVTNRSVLFVIMLSMAMAAAFLCLTDQVAQYGWSAFFVMFSIHLIVNKMRGGRHGR